MPEMNATRRKNWNSFTNPISNVLNELATRLKMMIRLRPKRSVNAPPGKEPIKPDMKKIANKPPTSVIPTANFFVMYRAKNGKSSEPPRRSTKLTATIAASKFL